MRNISRALQFSAAALVLSTAGLYAGFGAAQSPAKPAAQSAAKPADGSAQASQRTPTPQAKTAGDVDPASVQALQRMGAYLGTLKTFEVRADTTRDLVLGNGSRVQVGGVSEYKVRRPDAFQIDVNTDYMQRRFFYDGKQFTMFAPTLGFYATAAAPPTIHQTLDVLEDRYAISLPLQDLFRWNDPSAARAEQLSFGYVVGPAMIDGVQTDHYAFREGDRDWQIWIQRGDQPVPRKVVIVDRSDEARPAYVARLSWNVNPTLAANTFVFTPGPDAKAIRLAALEP